MKAIYMMHEALEEVRDDELSGYYRQNNDRYDHTNHSEGLHVVVK